MCSFGLHPCQTKGKNNETPTTFFNFLFRKTVVAHSSGERAVCLNVDVVLFMSSIMLIMIVSQMELSGIHQMMCNWRRCIPGSDFDLLFFVGSDVFS